MRSFRRYAAKYNCGGKLYVRICKCASLFAWSKVAVKALWMDEHDELASVVQRCKAVCTVIRAGLCVYELQHHPSNWMPLRDAACLPHAIWVGCALPVAR